MSKSDLEAAMSLQLRAFNMPDAEREFRFKPGRKWAFDFAWPRDRVALEIEGGVWTNGRHTRGAGFIGDCEKYNEAALLGWRVIRVVDKHIDSGKAIEWVQAALGILAPF